MGVADFLDIFNKSLAKMGPKSRAKEMVEGMVDYLPRADRVKHLLVPNGRTFALVDGTLWDSTRKTLYEGPHSHAGRDGLMSGVGSFLLSSARSKAAQVWQ